MQSCSHFECMLRQDHPHQGTFLLRFSDSELGGITVAWVGDEDGTLAVRN